MFKSINILGTKLIIPDKFENFFNTSLGPKLFMKISLEKFKKKGIFLFF